jgi:hypothetical protein
MLVLGSINVMALHRAGNVGSIGVYILNFEFHVAVRVNDEGSLQI